MQGMPTQVQAFAAYVSYQPTSERHSPLLNCPIQILVSEQRIVAALRRYYSAEIHEPLLCTARSNLFELPSKSINSLRLYEYVIDAPPAKSQSRPTEKSTVSGHKREKHAFPVLRLYSVLVLCSTAPWAQIFFEFPGPPLLVNLPSVFQSENWSYCLRRIRTTYAQLWPRHFCDVATCTTANSSAERAGTWLVTALSQHRMSNGQRLLSDYAE